MSDGPYKTLQMRPRWKAVAKRAYLEACSMDEVSEALGPALITDWRSEVSPSLISKLSRLVLGDGQILMFPDKLIGDVKDLARSCASVMEASVVSASVDAIIEGARGETVLHVAVEAALEDRCLSGFRQVEEHMFREASEGRTKFVRSRLEGAVDGAGLGVIARKLLGDESSPARSKIVKRSELDDGVSLRP